MVGAIYGDIVGSVFEFNDIKTKDFEMFCEKSSFTDDTVMTLAVSNALLIFDDMTREGNCFDAPSRNNLNYFKEILIKEMHTLGEKYPNAGYGGHFRFWLAEKQTEPYGSYGNGSAMRVSPVAWYANSLEECLDFAKASAEVTHNHPEGIKGAVVTAGATYLARTGATTDEIKAFVAKYYKIDFTLDEIRPTYEFNETCQDTVPQAMQAFFESIGDSDTDVPCMKLVNSYGGHAIGVYNNDTKDRTKVHKMMRDNRIKYYAEADYSENSEIDKLVKAIIDRTATNEVLENAYYECKKQTENFDKQNSEDEIQKMNLIIALESSGSFARTHSIVAELSKHKWIGEEKESLFSIAVENSQVFYILEDEDVRRFYKSLLKGSRSTSENAQKIREILG